MTTDCDWRRLSREAGFAVSGEDLLVPFPDGRKQIVHVEAGADGLSVRIWSVAGRPSELAGSAYADKSVHLAAWARNGKSDLVGFKVDSRGRLIGEAWAPHAGLGAEEWSIYVLAVARACDRTEYLLSGGDEA